MNQDNVFILLLITLISSGGIGIKLLEHYLSTKQRENQEVDFVTEQYRKMLESTTKAHNEIVGAKDCLIQELKEEIQRLKDK